MCVKQIGQKMKIAAWSKRFYCDYKPVNANTLYKVAKPLGSV